MTRARARAVHRARALDRRRPGGRAAAAGAGRPLRRRHVHRRSPAVPAGGQHGRPAGRRHRPRRHACAGGDRRPLRRAAGRGARRPGHRRGAGCRPRLGHGHDRPAAAQRRTARAPSSSAIGIGLPGPVEHSHRPGDQPADHARVGPLRRAQRTSGGPTTSRCSSTTTSTSWPWASSGPSSPTCEDLVLFKVVDRDRRRASSPAACCSAAPRERPATSGTSGSAAPRKDLCRCGNVGCVEAVAAGPAIARGCGRTAQPSGRPAMSRTRCGPATSPRSGQCARPGATSAGSWRWS